MRAIIGPNGAGKTTMMDVITGKTRPDEGDVMFDGKHDLTKLDEAEIATLGIGRKFQKPTVFEAHTVEDNLLLATKAPRGVYRDPVRPRGAGRSAQPSTRSSSPPGSRTIAPGSPARCRTARSNGSRSACCSRRTRSCCWSTSRSPGMTDAETVATAELLRDIARDHSVVVVEHDMAFVRELGVKVTLPARRLGAGRRHARSGQRRPARRRSLSGAVRSC